MKKERLELLETVKHHRLAEWLLIHTFASEEVCKTIADMPHDSALESYAKLMYNDGIPGWLKASIDSEDLKSINRNTLPAFALIKGLSVNNVPYLFMAIKSCIGEDAALKVMRSKWPEGLGYSAKDVKWALQHGLGHTRSQATEKFDEIFHGGTKLKWEVRIIYTGIVISIILGILYGRGD